MTYTTQNTSTRPTVSLGSTGQDVKDLQVVLNATVADNSLVVDGVFGNLTKEAVMAFQKEYGLTIDGIVGSQNWNKLESIDV